VDSWLEILKLLAGGVVGGLIGGWLTRGNDRERQLRETIIRETAQVSEGLSATIMQLQRLQESREPLGRAPIDENLLRGSPKEFRQIVEEVENTDLRIAPKVNAVRIFLGISPSVKARLTRFWINKALIEAKRFGALQESGSDWNRNPGSYGVYVSSAIASLEDFNRLAQDSLWSWPGRYRRWRERKKAVEEGQKELEAAKKTYDEEMDRILKEDIPRLQEQGEELEKEVARVLEKAARLQQKGEESDRRLNEARDRLIERLQRPPREDPASENKSGPHQED
jgi:hypothetical protein